MMRSFVGLAAAVTLPLPAFAHHEATEPSALWPFALVALIAGVIGTAATIRHEFRKRVTKS